MWIHKLVYIRTSRLAFADAVLVEIYVLFIDLVLVMDPKCGYFTASCFYWQYNGKRTFWLEYYWNSMWYIDSKVVYSIQHIFLLRDHAFSTCTKFSEKVTFRTPWNAHARVSGCKKWVYYAKPSSEGYLEFSQKSTLLRKYLTAFSRCLFLQKSSMVDVQLGSKYAADLFGGN